MGTSDRADELVRFWLLGRVRNYVPGDGAHLHYRDCPLLVLEWTSDTRPLSDVTSDDYTDFDVQWGCVHGPERMHVHLSEQGSLAELIESLDEAAEDMVIRRDMWLTVVSSPAAFCRGYPAAGEGGRVHDPAESR